MLGTTSFKLGPRFGVGWGAGESIEPPGRDGPQNVYLPYCPEQWPLVADGIIEPDYLWSCQETSGNLIDLCNSPGGVLTAGASVAYAQSVTGWTTKFVEITAEAAGAGFHATLGNLWNIGNQSLLLLLYAAIIQSSGPTRCLALLGGATNNVHIQAPTAGQVACFCGGSTVGSFIYENAVTQTVYPFLYSYDRRGAGRARVDTSKESIIGTWANYTDGSKGLGSLAGIASARSKFALSAGWVGNRAETMFDRGGPGLGGQQLVADLGWP